MRGLHRDNHTTTFWGKQTMEYTRIAIKKSDNRLLSIQCAKLGMPKVELLRILSKVPHGKLKAFLVEHTNEDLPSGGTEVNEPVVQVSL